MSISTPPASPPPVTGQAQPNEVKIYSHSPIFYWWPVWAVGFIMFTWTYFDGGRLYIFPGRLFSHDLDAKRDWRVELTTDKGTAVESREGVLITSKDEHLPPHTFKPGEPLPKAEQPDMRVSESKNPGVLFTITLLLIILISNVPLRGLWSIIVIVCIVLVAVVFALLGWWGYFLDVFSLLRIHINAGGYLFISGALFVIWAVTFFFFDRRTYMIFTVGQVRVCMEIGEGEKVYDTTGMVFQKQQNDFFRHWIVGLGAGDLIVKTGGTHSEVFDLPNVLFVGYKVKQIEQRLKSREVV